MLFSLIKSWTFSLSKSLQYCKIISSRVITLYQLLQTFEIDLQQETFPLDNNQSLFNPFNYESFNFFFWWYSSFGYLIWNSIYHAWLLEPSLCWRLAAQPFFCWKIWGKQCIFFNRKRCYQGLWKLKKLRRSRKKRGTFYSEYFC